MAKVGDNDGNFPIDGFGDDNYPNNDDNKNLSDSVHNLPATPRKNGKITDPKQRAMLEEAKKTIPGSIRDEHTQAKDLMSSPGHEIAAFQAVKDLQSELH